MQNNGSHWWILLAKLHDKVNEHLYKNAIITEAWIREYVTFVCDHKLQRNPAGKINVTLIKKTIQQQQKPTTPPPLKANRYNPSNSENIILCT